MAAGGTPGNVKLGPGRLYFAALGTAEPTLASAVLPSANWFPVGYTENGTQIDISITSEDIMVAEELEAIDNVMTARTIALTVEMAEATKKNLLLATGGGAANANDGTAFELPTPGTEVGVMMVWDSDLANTPTATNRRILFRAAKSSGTISTQRRKAPQKTTISSVFNCVKPDATNQAMKVFPNLLGAV